MRGWKVFITRTKWYGWCEEEDDDDDDETEKCRVWHWQIQLKLVIGHKMLWQKFNYKLSACCYRSASSPPHNKNNNDEKKVLGKFLDVNNEKKCDEKIFIGRILFVCAA